MPGSPHGYQWGYEMNMRELLGGLFWLAISVLVCTESWKSGIGSPRAPTPGFFPFWSGFVLGIFAVILIMSSSLRKRRGKVADLWKDTEWQKVIWILFPLFLYPLLLPTLGYLLTTFGLMISTTAIIDRSRLLRICIGTFSMAMGSYFIFRVFLKVQLPNGIFGF